MRLFARWALLALVVGGLWVVRPQSIPAAPAAPPASPVTPAPRVAPSDSCIDCHRNLGGRLAAPTLRIADDIHVKRGLSCSACHGGDPKAPGVEAMDPKKGFVGKRKPAQLAAACGSCH